jgi:hypothetical protein
MNQSLDILQGELERLFTLNELMTDLCRELLGIDPEELGGGGDGGDGGDGGGGGGGCGGSVSGFHIIASGVGARAYRDALESANHVEGLPAGGRGGPGGFSPGQSGTAGADGTAEAFRLAE